MLPNVWVHFFLIKVGWYYIIGLAGQREEAATMFVYFLFKNHLSDTGPDMKHLFMCFCHLQGQGPLSLYR